MKELIKGVLFDKDGTLFEYGDTWQVWCERVIDHLAEGDLCLRDRLAERGGYSFVDKTFTSNSLVVSASTDEIITAWAELHPTFGFKEIESVGLSYLKDLPLLPVCDLGQMITSLKAMGMAVGCGTNDYEASARNQLTRAGVLDHFDFVCGYDSGFGAKPEPGMLHAFAEHVGVMTSELAMVGDSTHDLHSGAAAGVALKVGVLTGPAGRDDLALAADVILESAGDLAGWLSSAEKPK